MSRCKKAGCGKNALSGKEHCLDHHKEQSDYSYGLDHDLQKKMESKYDPKKEKAVQTWIEMVVGKKFPSDFQNSLKTGVLICELVNKIWSGTINKINTNNMPFTQRENIVSYLDACKRVGMRETDLFVTQDLFEGDNLLAVQDNIVALGVLATNNKNFRGPHLIVSAGQVQVVQSLNGPPISYPSSSPAPAPSSSKPVAAPVTAAAPKAPAAAAAAPAAPAAFKPAAAPAPSKPAPASQSQAGGSSGGPKFCSDCGVKRESNAKFCGQCGKPY